MNAKYFDKITIESAKNGILVCEIKDTDVASFKSRPRVFTDFDEFVGFLREKICDEAKYSEIKQEDIYPDNPVALPKENLDAYFEGELKSLKEFFRKKCKEYDMFVKGEFVFSDQPVSSENKKKYLFFLPSDVCPYCHKIHQSDYTNLSVGTISVEISKLQKCIDIRIANDLKS